ncbi:hypothetical protein GA0115245_121228 [Streptomyces sp. di188]|nr:hypothetical protein GA0115238_130027 [Streptomyces sp. di50b]SCE09633.1 hypothetical protein GA0115245_121228 [Streptomyces sp. di188]
MHDVPFWLWIVFVVVLAVSIAVSVLRPPAEQDKTG